MTTILQRRSVTAGAVPTAVNLASGELAMNVADSKLFHKNAAGNIIDLVAFRLGFESVREHGAKLDGVTDDAAALNAAIAAAIASGRPVLVPAGNMYVNSKITVSTVGVEIHGLGVERTTITAGPGVGSSLLAFTSTSAECRLERLKLVTTGTSARCIESIRGQTLRCKEVKLQGDLNGPLFFSTGDIFEFLNCTFEPLGAATLAATLDSYNQNCSFLQCRIGGPGAGIRIVNSAGPRVEGLRIQNSFFINTGSFNVDLGNSYQTHITDSVLDQATDWCVLIRGGAEHLLLDTNWLGLRAGVTGTCVQMSAEGGGKHNIKGNTLFGGNTGVYIAATASIRIVRVNIEGNQFSGHANQSMQLDSAVECQVTGNQDSGTPTFGSWITTGTHPSGGSYKFDNNAWHTAPPAAFHAASAYQWGNDTGIVGRARGRVNVGSGATSAGVVHGLFTTPLTFLCTGYSSTSGLGSIFSNTPTGSGFTVTWSTAAPSGGATIYWEAQVT